MEERFVFLNKDHLSLSAPPDCLPIKNARFCPSNCSPQSFNPSNFDRQDIMTDRFEKDTTHQNQLKGLWAFYNSISKDLPPNQAKTASIIATVHTGIDKIKQRGAHVIFVRTPFSGPYWQGEQMGFSLGCVLGKTAECNPG
ncbi:hypothetical protein [Ferruginibacter sp.]|uniref:hypothetical protein n=1 Tax=Ferruginibacter sp. TaxID=1940288 RepID=UPI00265A552A|nr:hypothetical protein [Ferruginibacter sp.]